MAQVPLVLQALQAGGEAPYEGKEALEEPMGAYGALGGKQVVEETQAGKRGDWQQPGNEASAGAAENAEPAAKTAEITAKTTKKAPTEMKTAEIDFARLFPPPQAPGTFFSNFLHNGDIILKSSGEELVRGVYGETTKWRDITYPNRPFDANIGRDRFVRAAVEFTKAANYVYENRYNANLDVMRISHRVAMHVRPEIGEGQFWELLNVILVSLTKIELRK